MPKSNDRDQYLDGCLPALDSRRPEPCLVPRRRVTVLFAALLTCGVLLVVVCACHWLSMAF